MFATYMYGKYYSGSSIYILENSRISIASCFEFVISMDSLHRFSSRQCILILITCICKLLAGYHGIGSHVEDHLLELGLDAIRKETERYHVK